MKTEYTDLFDVFDVQPDADQTRIQNVVRSKIIDSHPDNNANITVGEFNSLKKAADILLDEQSRTEYLRMGHNTYTMQNVETGELEAYVFSGAREFEEQTDAADVSTESLLENNYEQMTSGLERLNVDLDLDIDNADEGSFAEENITESAEQIDRGSTNTVARMRATENTNSSSNTSTSTSASSITAKRILIAVVIIAATGLFLRATGIL